MAGMKKWPVSRWGQGWIAFVVALIVATYVFRWTSNKYFERYAREYPYEHDGQVGLSAFMDAFHAGAFTLVGVFIGLFVSSASLLSSR